MNRDSITPVIVRIVSRYLTGALVAVGLLTAAQGEGLLADAELQAGLTILIGGAVGWGIERAYAWARRHGGPT